jgi:hypothetical protein
MYPVGMKAGNTSLAWRCEIFFAHHSSPSPSHSPHHGPFTPVVPGYGVVLYEDDYLLLLLAADLRMDPALRPRPVSSVAFVYLGNAYNSTTRLNDGIFTVHRFSVATSARLHQSECVFRFYVSAEYLTTHRDYDLHVDRVVLVFFCFCLNVNSGALIPRRSTAHREGRRISFVKGYIIGYLYVVHVFVVYISRRDEGR